MAGKIIKYCDKIIEICLYLLIFCLPFAKAGVETFAWIAIAAWSVKKLLLFKIGKKISVVYAEDLNKALALFVIINALTVLVSVDFSLSIRAFFGKILKFIILYFCAVETINSKRRLRNIITVMIISAILIVTDAGVQYFSGKDFLRFFPYQRLRASFTSANAFGGWLIMFIPIFSVIFAAKQLSALGIRIKPIIMETLVVLMLICLALTNSRGAWLGFLSGLGLIFYRFTKAFRQGNKILLYLSMVVFLISALFVLPQTVKERINSIVSIDYSGLERMDLWKESLSIVDDFPILGCGLNTYSVVAPHYKISREGGIYPHNSFLQMAAETGLLGLLAFFWVLFRFFKMGLQNLNQGKNPLLLGILSGILAFLVHAFFDTHLYSLQLVVLFWFMMGFAVAVMRLEPNASQ